MRSNSSSVSESDGSCDCIALDNSSGCVANVWTVLVLRDVSMAKKLGCLVKYIERFIELYVVSFSQTLWINVHEYVRCYS